MSMTSTSHSKLTYRSDIDGLRAIAVLIVVIFHLHIGHLTGGFVGVDVFFVISGYLITRLLITDMNHGRFSFRHFYARRIRRLAPALLFTLALSTLAAFLLYSAKDFMRFGNSLLHTVASLSNIFFWNEAGYFDTTAINKPLLHTWSLSIEEQFYMFWPAMLLFLYAIKLQRLILWILMAFIAVGFPLAHFWFSKDANAAFYLLPFRLGEFALGAILAAPNMRAASKGLIADIICGLGLGLIIISALLFTSETPFPGLWAIPPCLGTSLLIWAGPSPIIGRILSMRPFVWTGLISYSLYLIHWPLIVFWQAYTFRPLTLVDSIIIIIISFALAGLMYRFVEQPFRQPNKSKVLAGQKSPFILISLLSLASFGMIALSIVKSGGFPSRIPQINDTQSTKQVRRHQNATNLSLKKALPYSYNYTIGQSRTPEKRFLVTGDSHAGRLDAFTQNISDGKQWQFIFSWRTGCFPLLDMRASVSPQGDNSISCRTMRRELLSLIKNQKIDGVILTGRWTQYLEPSPYGDIDIERRFFIKRKKTVIDQNAAREYFETKIRDTVKTLTRQGVKIILISQPPPPPHNMRGCSDLPQWFISAKNQALRCQGSPRDIARARTAFTDQLFREIADDYGQMAIIPSDVFCPPKMDRCLGFQNGGALYSDTNHLSDYGSVFLANHVKNDMLSFLDEITP